MTIRGGLLTSAEKTLKINWDETDLSAALASKVNNPSITALTQFGSTLRPFFSLLTLTVQSGQQNGDSGINLVVGNANYGKLMTLTGGVWGAAVSDADPDVLLADTAYINSLRTAVLITGVIKATMIDVTSLGAISATIGTVTAATINDSDGNTVLYSHARGGAYLSNIQTARIGWSSRFSTQKEYMLIDGMTIGFVDQSLGTHNIVEVLTDLSGNVTGINLTCKDITITTGGKVDGVYVSALGSTVSSHITNATTHGVTGNIMGTNMTNTMGSSGTLDGKTNSAKLLTRMGPSFTDAGSPPTMTDGETLICACSGNSKYYSVYRDGSNYFYREVTANSL